MRVSLFKIFKSDYASVLLLLFPLIAFALFIDSKYFGVLHELFSENTHIFLGNYLIFLWMSIASIVICFPLLFFRIKSIQNHFKNGLEVIGEIVFVELWKDRGRVEYEYEIDGKKYRSGNALHRNKFVNSLKKGQKINVIVSKENFKKALIKDMYLMD